jgi:hypothetical protein
MEAKVGQFIKAKVQFEEDDGRYKIRPCLVLRKVRTDFGVVYLCAPMSSQINKSRGDEEVVISQKDAMSVGFSASSVIRFSSISRVAVLEADVTNVFGSFKSLPSLTNKAICRAAKTIGFPL